MTKMACCPLQSWLSWYQPGGCQSCGGAGRVLEPLPRCTGCVQGVPLWADQALLHLPPSVRWDHGEENL